MDRKPFTMQGNLPTCYDCGGRIATKIIGPQLTGTASLVPPESQPHSNGVNQIVGYQSGSDRQGKLRGGCSDEPMLIARSAAAGVRSAPPAVHNACCDCQYDEKREPAARSVEQSFGSAFPTSQRQAKQPENPSNAHSNQGESKS